MPEKSLQSVGCGLTSHSAIFQLYSDGTFIQVLLPGTRRPSLQAKVRQSFFSGKTNVETDPWLRDDAQRHGQLKVFSLPSLP